MPVVLLPPEFGIHLQPDILKIDFSVHGLHISLSNVVRRRLPVTAVREVGQLLAGRKQDRTAYLSWV